MSETSSVVSLLLLFCLFFWASSSPARLECREVHKPAAKTRPPTEYKILRGGTDVIYWRLSAKGRIKEWRTQGVFLPAGYFETENSPDLVRLIHQLPDSIVGEVTETAELLTKARRDSNSLSEILGEAISAEGELPDFYAQLTSLSSGEVRLIEAKGLLGQVLEAPEVETAERETHEPGTHKRVVFIPVGKTPPSHLRLGEPAESDLEIASAPTLFIPMKWGNRKAKILAGGKKFDFVRVPGLLVDTLGKKFGFEPLREKIIGLVTSLRRLEASTEANRFTTVVEQGGRTLRLIFETPPEDDPFPERISLIKVIEEPSSEKPSSQDEPGQ
ncbi:MAG: hypothetical protein C5B49_09635 [Bdellovibrio sp.]|nr:MAG: hypothetical protein C5B49_09635 [Bdellovibrio sp.]